MKKYFGIFFLSILFIVGYILTENFNVINYEEIIWNKSTISNPLLFMTLYLLNIIVLI